MSSIKNWLALSFTVTSGCAVLLEDGDVDPPNEGIKQELTAFSFDSTALATRPTGLLPKTALTLDRIQETNIATRLLGATDAPQLVESRDTSRLFKTAGWEFEQDATAGRVMAVSSLTPKLAVALDDATLQKRSLDRLASFGVGPEEMGRVLQRKALRQDFDGTLPARPVLHSHKTFVYRTIGGIPVVGHRAVVSHAADGSVRKVLMTWPALAKSGHALRTQLSNTEIETRAAEALAKSGESTGKASLSWRYLPVRTATGEVALKLSVAAHIKGSVDADGTTEEPRIVEVDVAAVP